MHPPFLAYGQAQALFRQCQKLCNFLWLLLFTLMVASIHFLLQTENFLACISSCFLRMIPVSAMMKEVSAWQSWVSESWRAPRLCPTCISCQSHHPSKISSPCTSWARLSATCRFVWVSSKLRNDTSPVFLRIFPFSLVLARSLHTTPFQASPTKPEEKSLQLLPSKSHLNKN